MKIPLSDPVWSRLYGPYGLQDVAGILKRLFSNWDDELAEDLFWENLHHQDDLYPVTYAALPWLWEIAPRSRKDSDNALLFFSHVLFCATCPGGTGSDSKGPRGRYRGLSLRVRDHQHNWIPSHRHLLAADMETLRDLQNWFSATAPEIAECCVGAVSEGNRYLAAMLSTGFAALNRGFNTAVSMTLWADNEDLDFILEHHFPTEQDRHAANAIRRAIENRSTELAQFLRKFADSNARDSR